MIHLDSCFVIDLKRELREGREGPAHEALRRTADRRLTVSTFVLAELEKVSGSQFDVQCVEAFIAFWNDRQGDKAHAEALAQAVTD